MTKLLALFSILFAAAGCSSDSADIGAKAADSAAAPSTLLQFVPSTETEYPRQEAALQANRHHYRLVRSVLIEGALTGADGTPLSGHVRFSGATRTGDPDPVSVRFSEQDVTEGKFITSLVPGDYVADLVPGLLNWPAQRQYINLSADKPKADFVVAAGTLYQGTVSDSTGQPLPGVAVRAVSSDGTLSSQVAISGSDGSYRMAVGPDATKLYRLEFAQQDRPSPRVTFDSLPATTPTATLSIQYLPTTNTTVSGKVLDKATGRGAADVSVLFTASPGTPVVAARRIDTGGGNNAGEAVFLTKTDAAGNFSLVLPQGGWSYTLTLQPPLDRPYGGKLVGAPKLGPNNLYELAPKVAVTGKVVDEAGRAVSLAEIVLTKTLSLKDAQQVQRLYTDEAGQFDAHVDAAVGAYDVTVTPLRGGLARCTRSAVDLRAFGEAFVVHRGIRHEGFVEDEDGRPLPRVSVRLADRGSQVGVPARILAEGITPTDADGRFEFYAPLEPNLTGCRTNTRATTD